MGKKLTALLAQAAFEESVPASHFGYRCGRERRNCLPTLGRFGCGLVEWVKLGETVTLTPAGIDFVRHLLR